MTKTVKNILIPVDLTYQQSIKAVLPIAINFADSFKSKLHFVYVIPDYGMKMIEDYLPKNWLKEQKSKYEAQMRDLVLSSISDETNIDISFSVSRGPVYDEVINLANIIDADLIIISAVRPQLKDYMLGPNAAKIVRHAEVSVLVVR